MAFKIIWTDEAKSTYLAIIDYLEKEWTEKEIIKFVKSVHNRLSLLTDHPALGKIHKRRYRIYKTLVHKNVSMVYHSKPRKKEIVILTFWDNRQNPNKLKY